MMYSKRGAPNRLRPTSFRELAQAQGLRTLGYETTTRLDESAVEECRARLLPRYRALPADDLSTLDFLWIIAPQP